MLRATRLVWWQSVAGLPPCAPPPGRALFVDYGFTLPAPAPSDTGLPGAATLWGLHIAEKAADAGAVLLVNDPALYAAVGALIQAEDLPDAGRALVQCRRLAGPDGLAARLQAVLGAVRFGMDAGAGVPTIGEAGAGALPYGLAVRIPDGADPATFISYVRNENVALDWLPELQPIFYAAYQVTRDRALTFRTAAHLARWVITPLGPDFNEDEVVHAVLGILKAAEYTGVRWYTDAERAAWYGNLMLEWYGPAHDAYRPAFLERAHDGSYLAERPGAGLALAAD
jgi:hypothetical protein